MVEHRNTTATVRMVLKACAAAGIDTEHLLRISGIDRQTAELPDGEVSFETMRGFWKNAYQISGDPCLALRAAQQVEVGTYKCLDYLMVHAKTIGDSLENCCRYMLLINTWIGWEILKDDEVVTLRMVPVAGPIPPPSFEFVFAMYTCRTRLLDRPDWKPAAVSFPLAPPPDPQVHTDFFGVKVQYQAPFADFVVSRESWETRLQSADDRLLEILDEHARLLLEKRALPDDFVGQVRQEIIRQLHGGEIKRDTIAGNLNMSPRTLQRRLEDHGVVFVDLLDSVRADLAKNKLRNSDLSLAEVGFLLGFSDQSAFTRAFKRWTGKTPREYRL